MCSFLLSERWLACVLAALLTAPLAQVALSVVGAAVLNLTLAINHRAGRYIAN